MRDEKTGKWISDLPDVFDLICDKLRNKEAFSFSRWGDGEFNAVYGKKGHNCDGHEYFEDMGLRLRKILESNPKYIMGLQPLTQESSRWLQIRKDFPDIQWVNADSIHNASIEGKLMSLLNLLDSDTTLIGGSHLKEFASVNKWEFIEIPGKNCWLYFKELVSIIKSILIYEHNHEFKFILCASMMSEVIIDEFKDYDNVTFIDLGSVLDPYAGVKSRRYHHKLNINASI